MWSNESHSEVSLDRPRVLQTANCFSSMHAGAVTVPRPVPQCLGFAHSGGQPRKLVSSLAPSPTSLTTIASWNVEGLRLECPQKLCSIIAHMSNYNISTMCIQESHISGAPYLHQNGYLIVLSDSHCEGREYAVVGFIVAPRVIGSVKSFHQYSNRLTSLVIRVHGGYIQLITAYAPHGGHALDARIEFHDELVRFCGSKKVHGPTFVLGDFNARLARCSLSDRLDRDKCVIGPAVFTNGFHGTSRRHSRCVINAELLAQTCHALDMLVSNTFFNRPAERQVTYFDLSIAPLDDISTRGFAQLHLLADRPWHGSITDVWSDPSVALESHHFLLFVQLSLLIPRTPKLFARRRQNLKPLRNAEVADAYRNGFLEAGAVPHG